MGVLPKIPSIVYRIGSSSLDNCTPRPGKDTLGGPGKAPGLSTFESLNIGPGQKAQVIDLRQLKVPLRAVPDDASLGGTEDHVSIVPVDAFGNIDHQSLQDWAASRGTGRIHPFTQIVRDAIIQAVR